MMDEREALTAWAAGLFEGEGSFSRGRGVSMRMELSMTDEDVVRRFHAAVGVGSIYEKRTPTRPTRKLQWRWACNDWDDVESLVGAFWPWLGQRRQDRFLELRWASFSIREPWRRKPKLDRCGHGHDDWEVRLDGRRHCRPCKRERDRVSLARRRQTVTESANV